MSIQRRLIYLTLLPFLAVPVVYAADVRDSMSSIASVSAEDAEPTMTGDAEFVLRSYQAQDDTGHHRRRNTDFVGIDVSHYLTLCEDGNAQVRAIALGSWQFDLDGECAADKMTTDINVAWQRLTISGTD